MWVCVYSFENIFIIQFSNYNISGKLALLLANILSAYYWIKVQYNDTTRWNMKAPMALYSLHTLVFLYAVKFISLKINLNKTDLFN